ncbi:MAG: ArsR/SmtB family transcription factor [Acidimicrobiales bacterium]
MSPAERQPAGGAGPIFAVLADDTRRQLLDQLSREGPSSATNLAQAYPVSRQAIAKHLSVLAHAGLVVGERTGRDVRYRVVGGRLDGAATWLAEVSDRWDRRLHDLVEQVSEQG